MSVIDAELVQRVHNDFLDSYDEELELEFEDRIFDRIGAVESLDESGGNSEYYS